jgi:hypothetical protein
MPTRRTLELVVISIIALHPVFAMAKLWAHKTLAETSEGSIAHGTAEIVSVIA